MKKVKAEIIGGAGYTGGELLRILLNHPDVEIKFVQSSSNANKPVYEVHSDLLGETNLNFSETHSPDADVIFLCGGHDSSRKFLSENKIPGEVVVIDLSQDFRLHASSTIGKRNFIYGLPELNREKIKAAKSVANPGCFATGIELALLPLASAKKINSSVHVTATTGSTGAGQALSATTHFSTRNNNLSVYKVFEHQHLKEITESLKALQPGLTEEILFIPHRGNFTRGILAAVYLECSLDIAEIQTLYKNYYSAHPFVTVSDAEVELKQVVNTNRCFLHVAKHKKQVFITSVIDNLLKGASGQAVQNMNLIFGLPEKAGLQLKPSAF